MVMLTRQQLRQMWERVVSVYKSKNGLKYDCGYRISAEDSVSDCSGATKHFTVKYVLTDPRYLETVKRVCGYQRSMKHFGTFLDSRAVEQIDITGAPSVHVYLDPTTSCERVCCAVFLPFCIPLVAYQCCMAEEIEENAMRALFQLIEQGEQWVTDTLAKAEDVLREQQRFNVPPVMVYAQQPRAERGGAAGYSPAQFPPRAMTAGTRGAEVYSADQDALFIDVMRTMSAEQRSDLVLQYTERELLSDEPSVPWGVQRS